MGEGTFQGCIGKLTLQVGKKVQQALPSGFAVLQPQAAPECIGCRNAGAGYSIVEVQNPHPSSIEDVMSRRQHLQPDTGAGPPSELISFPGRLTPEKWL